MTTRQIISTTQWEPEFVHQRRVLALIGVYWIGSLFLERERRNQDNAIMGCRVLSAKVNRNESWRKMWASGEAQLWRRAWPSTLFSADATQMCVHQKLRVLKKKNTLALSVFRHKVRRGSGFTTPATPALFSRLWCARWSTNTLRFSQRARENKEKIH